MHELALCQALLSEVERLSRDQRGATLRRIVVKMGPLAGVEPALLRSAFEFARAGGAADAAELAIEPSPVRVQCLQCSAESDVAPNRLVCAVCGSYRTRLLCGDELTLQRLEFQAAAAAH